MPDQDTTMSIEGMEETLAKLTFLESTGVNDGYLKPAMKSIGSKVKSAEKPHIPVFSSSTQKSLFSKVTTNGIGSVTLTVGPNSKRKHIFRFISGGAQWHGRADTVTTWRGKERKRNARADKAVKSGGSANSSYLPASALVEWVKKKLGVSDEEALHTAFRVAKTIGKRGLPGKPIVPPTVEEIRDMVISTLSETIHQMVEGLKNHGK